VVKQNIMVGSTWWSKDTYLLTERKQRENKGQKQNIPFKSTPCDLLPATRPHLLIAHSV
jgi:hypothetical protein